jgi:hypothetical protein
MLKIYLILKNYVSQSLAHLKLRYTLSNALMKEIFLIPYSALTPTTRPCNATTTDEQFFFEQNGPEGPRFIPAVGDDLQRGPKEKQKLQHGPTLL